MIVGKKKENHIKKPLNAFILYVKEMRLVVQAECMLKESAAINKGLSINQILARRVSSFCDIYIRHKNPKIKNGFEYSGTQHRLQNYILITML